MTKKIGILIVDDHPIFRHGLKAAIERNSDLSILGEAENGQEALELIEQIRPDVVVLDVDMPVLDGIETARILQKRGAEAKTIFLTLHKDKSILRALNSLKVNGYVLKDSAITEIVECIRAVIAGKIYLSPALNDIILENAARSTDAETLALIDGLTPAEKQVLSLITESKTNREIAEALFVSVRTIETHRYNICSKLSLSGTHALFKFALKNKKTIRLLAAK